MRLSLPRRSARGRRRHTLPWQDRNPPTDRKAGRTIAPEPEIGDLPATAADDAGAIATLTTLVNEVYTAAEEGLWADGAARTTTAEVAALVRAGQLAVARLAGRLVGCIRIQRLDDDTSEFGMLAADLRHRGAGVGRGLVRYAEQRGRDAGSAAMRLELLVPREWTHPSKRFLAGWYGRLGYQVVRVRTVEESYPELAPLLTTPCDFVTHQKDLRA
jgi:GNAT superfamily N-acetyltransferase